MGLCYICGSGIEKDEKEVFRLFQVAVDDESSDGYVQLGLCYKQAIGVEKHVQEAVRFFSLL